MIRRPPRSTLDRSSAASDVYKRQVKRMAQKGQEIQTYKDMIKDPYVLEFTGLSPTAKLYENSYDLSLIHISEPTRPY